MPWFEALEAYRSFGGSSIDFFNRINDSVRTILEYCSDRLTRVKGNT